MIRSKENNKEICIMRYVMNFTLHKFFFGWLNQERWQAKKFLAWIDENYIKGLVRKLGIPETGIWCVKSVRLKCSAKLVALCESQKKSVLYIVKYSSYGKLHYFPNLSRSYFVWYTDFQYYQLLLDKSINFDFKLTWK